MKRLSKKEIRYREYLVKQQDRDESRKTKYDLDEKGHACNIQVMTRSIARNMARRAVGGNKGIGDVFREIYKPIRNYDKKHRQEIEAARSNQKYLSLQNKLKEAK